MTKEQLCMDLALKGGSGDKDDKVVIKNERQLSIGEELRICSARRLEL